MAKKQLPKLRPAAPLDGAQDTAGMYAALAHGGAMRNVPVEAIVQNPSQPRKTFAAEPLASLAASIENVGLLHPPRVRELEHNRYELISGERRWRAVKELGHAEITVVIGDQIAGASALAALVENVEREDLTPIEQAHAYVLLVEEFGLSREELGRQLSRSRSAISNTIRLLDLPDNAIELLSTRQLSAAHGRELLTEPDHTQRATLAARAIAKSWTVEQLAQAIGAAGRKAAKPGTASSDHRAAADELAEQLARRSGRETKLAPRRGGGFRLVLDFNDADDVAGFVNQLSPPA